MSPRPWQTKGGDVPGCCLKLLLHFLGFFLNFLAASFDVLAGTGKCIATGKRNRACRGDRQHRPFFHLELTFNCDLSIGLGKHLVEQRIVPRGRGTDCAGCAI